MSKVRAVVTSRAATSGLAIGDVDAPIPASSDAVVRVAAIGLNRGEVRGARTAPEGSRIGWDFAGTIERAAADGSGPPAGTRVLGILENGAWAEQVAVPTRAVAPLPDGVTFSQAATLPLAGLTAWLALEKAGGLLQRTVLVTGASDGGGYFAVQLACDGGARVVAQVRNADSVALVQANGAQHVVVGMDAAGAAGHGPYDLIVDSMGGTLLASLLKSLAPDGLAVAYLASTDATLTFDLHAFLGTGGLRLYGFSIFYELRQSAPRVGLSRLAALVAAGRLRPLIAAEANWSAIDSVSQAMLEGGPPGKTVLLVPDR
jgi:NADPH:quinone reductase-like Zn-dependent oxidoreductase